MDEEIYKKILKARKLKTKKMFPFSLFTHPDYTESGSLLCDAAKSSMKDEDKIKLYREAAETFLMDSDEYCVYRAGQCFKKLFDMQREGTRDEAIESYKKYCECCMRIEKYMLAGEGYSKLGDYVVEKDKKMAIEMYKKAQQMYQRDNNCPVHSREAGQKCLGVQLMLGDVEGMLETLEKVEVEHGKLCRQLLAIQAGRTDVDEELGREESELVRTVLNKDKETGIKVLSEFAHENVLMAPISKIFEFIINNFQPENDIC